MKDLSESRERITEIDKAMAELFEERMHLAKDIAEYKMERGLPVKDKKREEALFEKNEKNIKDPDLLMYYVNFLRGVVDISCSFQENLMSGMKVAYGGTEGAFACIAAKAMFPTARLISNHDFTAAYRSVVEGECDCAVLPIENSVAGEVGAVMDMMFSGPLFINRVYSLPVRHQLLGLPGADIKDIKTVISHPQALEQCSGYIRKHGFEILDAANTSFAAKRILELKDPAFAAIGSDETAALNKLEILDHDLQDDGSNTTRFAAFSRTKSLVPDSSGHEGDHFILVFTVRNEAGALSQALNIIGAHGYNMRSLMSRPMKDLQWSYYFFIEAEGNVNNANGHDMMQELSAITAGLKLVGSYKLLFSPEPRATSAC